MNTIKHLIAATVLLGIAAPALADEQFGSSDWYRSGTALTAADIAGQLSDGASLPDLAQLAPVRTAEFVRPARADISRAGLNEHDHAHFDGYCPDGFEHASVKIGTAQHFAEIGENFVPGQRYDSHLSVQHDTKNLFAKATIDWDGVF